MSYLEKITFLVLVVFSSSFSFAQTCGEEVVISICDMSIIDSDNSDGNNIPDGIINLYDEYVTQNPLITPVDNGTWVIINQQLRASLDTATGDLSLWDLPRASETVDDYVFELTNAQCTSGVALTLKLILGPYSGIARVTSPTNDISLESCDSDIVDMNNTLLNDISNGIPPGHLNGTWSYDGTSTIVTRAGGSSWTFEIPYDSSEVFNQEVFEFTYTVLGIGPCDPVQQTTVKISVTRQVSAGSASLIFICEDEFEDPNNIYENDIMLSDDEYLLNEDLGGNWVPDITGEIDGPTDQTVNIRRIYDQLVADKGIRFGCETYDFKYGVQKRSVVCVPDTATVQFSIYEKLRPFGQSPTVPVPEFCANTPESVSLYSLLEFTEEVTPSGPVSFEYNDDRFTNWRLISGNSDLGLVTQTSIPPPGYSSFATITTNNIPGEYVFEYAVHPRINCAPMDLMVFCNPYSLNVPVGSFCDLPCDVLTGQVRIIINPVDYAGEDTPSAQMLIPEFCESEGTIDLRSVLETNGDAIATTGIWTDDDGLVVPNDFPIPTLNTELQNFNFTYTTTTDKGCIDSATLTIRIYKEPNAGVGGPFSVCRLDENRDAITIDLFSFLTGAADTNGFWTEERSGYNSNLVADPAPHLGRLNLASGWPSGTYVYTVPSNSGCTTSDVSSIELTINESIPEIENVSGIFCKEEGQTNLFNLLPQNTNLSGVFTVGNNTDGAIVPNGGFVFADLPGDLYNFTYTVNDDNCFSTSANVEVLIIDTRQPDVVSPTEFCILEAATLASVEQVAYSDIDETLDDVVWYAAPDGDQTVPLNTLLIDGQKLYVAVQADGCESTRLEVTFNILNLGEGDCTLEFQDGVTPDVPGENDSFNITQWRDQNFNIPTVFETFELQIFNRYGTLVYKANQSTEEFRGIGNTGIQLGKNLPSGVYFYVLNPNKNDNRPIQGNFYLSK